MLFQEGKQNFKIKIILFFPFRTPTKDTVTTRHAYVKYPKDPMPVPVDLEGLLHKETILRRLRRERKRRAPRIPPMITLTNPEKKTKIIYAHPKCKLVKRVTLPPEDEQPERTGSSSPPPIKFSEDGPHDSKEFSSGFTMANLLIYMFFGAIMYVKVRSEA